MHYMDSYGNEYFAERTKINGIVRVVRICRDGSRSTIASRATYLAASNYARRMGKL